MQFWQLDCVSVNVCGCYRKVIWNICPKLTCWVLLSYPCSISPNRVSLKWTSCLGHFGPSQLSDCRRQERPSSASLYSCTHLRRRREKLTIWCTICDVCEPFLHWGEMICMYSGWREARIGVWLMMQNARDLDDWHCTDPYEPTQDSPIFLF